MFSVQALYHTVVAYEADVLSLIVAEYLRVRQLSC